MCRCRGRHTLRTTPPNRETTRCLLNHERLIWSLSRSNPMATPSSQLRLHSHSASNNSRWRQQRLRAVQLELPGRKASISQRTGTAGLPKHLTSECFSSTNTVKRVHSLRGPRGDTRDTTQDLRHKISVIKRTDGTVSGGREVGRICIRPPGMGRRPHRLVGRMICSSTNNTRCWTFRMHQSTPIYISIFHIST